MFGRNRVKEYIVEHMLKNGALIQSTRIYSHFVYLSREEVTEGIILFYDWYNQHKKSMQLSCEEQRRSAVCQPH